MTCSEDTTLTDTEHTCLATAYCTCTYEDDDDGMLEKCEICNKHIDCSCSSGDKAATCSEESTVTKEEKECMAKEMCPKKAWPVWFIIVIILAVVCPCTCCVGLIIFCILRRNQKRGSPVSATAVAVAVEK